MINRKTKPKKVTTRMKFDGPLGLQSNLALSILRYLSVILQAKDIMYYLYMNAREHMQKNLPKEVRILKYLLTVEDTDKLLCDLKDAFTPGGELVENSDFVYTYVIRNLFSLICCFISR